MILTEERKEEQIEDIKGEVEEAFRQAVGELFGDLDEEENRLYENCLEAVGDAVERYIRGVSRRME